MFYSPVFAWLMVNGGVVVALIVGVIGTRLLRISDLQWPQVLGLLMTMLAVNYVMQWWTEKARNNSKPQP